MTQLQRWRVPCLAASNKMFGKRVFTEVDSFRIGRDSGAIPKGVAETAVTGSLRRVPDASHDFGAHPIESLAPYLSPLHCAESETLDGSPSSFFKGPSMNARTPLALDRSVRGYPLE